MQKKITEVQRISLENDTLREARICFDEIVNGILTQMTEKGVKEGEATLKINISLTESSEDTPEGERKVIMPTFIHKATGSYKQKAELSGQSGGAEYELIELDGGWGLRSYQNGQMEFEI